MPKLPTLRRQYSIITSPVGGLRWDVPSTLIDKRETPNCSEVLYTSKIIQKCPGTTYFSITSTTSLSGTVNHIDTYTNSAGTEKLMVHTTKNLYYYDSATDTIICLTPQYKTGTCNLTSASTAVVGVGTTWATNVKAGDDIVIGSTGTSASLTYYIVDAVQNNTGLSLTSPYLLTTSTGNVYVVRKCYTGDEDNHWSSEVIKNTSGTDIYCTSNHIDNGIWYWDMSLLTAATLNGTSVYHCWKLVKYGERLCMYRTTENGTAYPQTVRWCVAGNPENWTGTGSGSTNLNTVMGVDAIQSAAKLGNYVAIYGEKSVILQDYLTDVNNPFAFFNRISKFGLVAPRALVNMGSHHLFMGWENMYAYDGGRTLTPVGDAISIIFEDGSINPSAINRSFAMLKTDPQVVLFYYPSTNATTCDNYLLYDTVTKRWSKGKRSYSGFGYYTTKSQQTWDSLTQTWDSATFPWDTSTLLNLSPLNLVGTTSGKIEYDTGLSNNLADGTVVDGWWTTKDFTSPNRYRDEEVSWMSFIFEAIGTSVDVSYSTDGGSTWSTSYTIQLSLQNWKEYTWDIEVWSTRIRFRMRNNTSGGTFNARVIGMGYVGDSDRSIDSAN